MSLQTEFMRNESEKQIVICKDEKGYFAVEYVNHPTPSGLDRWVLTLSDKRRFKTEQEAADAFNIAINGRVDEI
jgi:hypothetical protein